MNKDLLYLVVIGVLVGASFFFYDQWQKSLETVRQKESIITEQSAEIKYRKTKEERIIATKDAAVLSSQEIAKAYPQVIEQLKKEFDIKLKDVRAYIRNEFEARGQGVSTITNYYVDSAGNKIDSRELLFDDGYLMFRSVLDSSSHAMSTYVYRDTISTILSTKKKWFLGNEKMYASSMLQNKNALVTGSTNLMVSTYRDKRWTLSAGAYYDPIRQDYGLGIIFGYALIKF
jgi:hypothetical protein